MPESSYDDRIEAHKAKMFQLLPELASRLDWNDETLRAHRRQGLHEILNFAATHSQWHAQRLASFDLNPIDPADLQSLPIMTKADVMQNWDQIVTDQRLSLAAASAHVKALEEGPGLLHDEYHVFTTGGTTGEPGVFCVNSDEMATWLAASLRLAMKVGFMPE